jgi:hypothetical protein
LRQPLPFSRESGELDQVRHRKAGDQYRRAFQNPTKDLAKMLGAAAAVTAADKEFAASIS